MFEFTLSMLLAAASDYKLRSAVSNNHNLSNSNKKKFEVAPGASSEPWLGSQLGTFDWKPARDVSLEASSKRLRRRRLWTFA